MGVAKVYTAGVIETASEYVFVVGMNKPMRYAIQRFLEVNREREGNDVYIPMSQLGDDIRTLVRTLKGQFQWIDDHCDHESGEHLFTAEPSPQFDSNTIIGTWPYMILFVSNEETRNAFLDDEDETIFSVLEHFESQCAVLDPQVEKRERREQQIKDERRDRQEQQEQQERPSLPSRSRHRDNRPKREPSSRPFSEEDERQRLHHLASLED